MKENQILGFFTQKPASADQDSFTKGRSTPNSEEIFSKNIIFLDTVKHVYCIINDYKLYEYIIQLYIGL